MNTTEKGDLAEQHVVLKALSNGWGVSVPIGRPAYDLIFDIKGQLLKIQVKAAWYEKDIDSYIVDARRTKTNRKVMVRKTYCENDFDFAICYIFEKDIFYIFPIRVFRSYKSQIYLIEGVKRQRKPKSSIYKENWDLLSNYKSTDLQ